MRSGILCLFTLLLYSSTGNAQQKPKDVTAIYRSQEANLEHAAAVVRADYAAADSHASALKDCFKAYHGRDPKWLRRIGYLGGELVADTDLFQRDMDNLNLLRASLTRSITAFLLASKEKSHGEIQVLLDQAAEVQKKLDLYDENVPKADPDWKELLTEVEMQTGNDLASLR